jgi:hypothetical protein
MRRRNRKIDAICPKKCPRDAQTAISAKPKLLIRRSKGDYGISWVSMKALERIYG